MLTLSQLTQSERASSILFAIGFHLLLMALVIITTSSQPSKQKVGSELRLSAVMLAAPATSEQPPVPPGRVGNARPLHASPDAGQAEAVEQGSQACDVFQAVSQDLRASPDALAAVMTVPTDARSIADAVVIWNAGWSATASSDEAPLNPARLVVEHRLASTPPACLNEPISGPRLVPIPNGDRTMFLAFGSGEWNWQQLLDDKGSEVLSSDPPIGEHSDALDWLERFIRE